MINGLRPAAVKRKELIGIFGSPKLVQRLIAASHFGNRPWLRPVTQGRHTLYSTDSVEAAVERIKTERPPLLPSELRRRPSGAVGPDVYGSAQSIATASDPRPQRKRADGLHPISRWHRRDLLRDGTDMLRVLAAFSSGTDVALEVPAALCLLTAAEIAHSHGVGIVTPNGATLEPQLSALVVAECSASTGWAAERMSEITGLAALRCACAEYHTSTYQRRSQLEIQTDLNNNNRLILFGQRDKAGRHDWLGRSVAEIADIDLFGTCEQALQDTYRCNLRQARAARAKLLALTSDSHRDNLDTDPTWLLTLRLATAYHILSALPTPELTGDDFAYALTAMQHDFNSRAELRTRFLPTLQ